MQFSRHLIAVATVLATVTLARADSVVSTATLPTQAPTQAAPLAGSATETRTSETYAMLLAGLAALGLIASRRRQV